MEKERARVPEKTDELLNDIIQQNERRKEEELVNLILEIIVSSTLREYYETCHTLSEIQPARAK